MAQIGSRLIDAAAAKITEDFFKAFEAHLQAGARRPAARRQCRRRRAEPTAAWPSCGG